MDLINKTPVQRQKDIEKIHKEFVKSWGMTPQQAREYAETGINPVTGYNRGIRIIVNDIKPSNNPTTKPIKVD